LLGYISPAQATYQGRYDRMILCDNTLGTVAPFMANTRV